MKKTWVWVPLIIGVLMLIAAVALHIKRVSEQSTMVETRGQVVAVVEGCVTVEFKTSEQRSVQFNGSVCQKPPAFVVGEQVPVLYAPENPSRAHINTFAHNWFLSLLFGFIGLCALVTGGACVWMITLAGWRAKRRTNLLKRTGRSIQAQLMNVEPTVSVTLNGRNPWRIVAQWLDPATGKVRLFYSQNFWFDPSPYLTTNDIQVWIDPQRPNRYSVDTDFLPQLA
ncbi:DUF3592 domain-containing protein [Pseudomonas gingeri]